MLGLKILIRQCKNMYKAKLYIILLIFISPYINAADILDIYNRSLKFNTDLKIMSNDHKISEEIYNQTSSSIFKQLISVSKDLKTISLSSCMSLK